jgi:hypothetical protein
MTTKKQPDRKLPGLVLVVLIAVLCAACGAKLIRGESPMVRMSELSHQDDAIAVQLSIRNVNDEPLDILSIDVALIVSDSDDDDDDGDGDGDDGELFTYTGPVDTNIIANGTETWSVEVTESEASRKLLDSLQNGDVKSLPYSLNGSIKTANDGNLRFEHEGHIYPLPGRPGHFR